MTPEGKRIFAYVRASTKKQVDSPEAQKELISEYCKMLKLGGIDGVFMDSATSGKVPMIERVAGKELVSRLRSGDVLVIAKLDRAFRRLSDCCVILEQLERIGVEVHICNMMGGALNLRSPMGKFLIHILGAFAELEREFISQRTREGMAHLEMRGVKVRHHAAFGYTWGKSVIDGKEVQVRVRCDEEREVMRRIVAWRTEVPVTSWRDISIKLAGETTKNGGKWTIPRCHKCYHAELALMIRERNGAK